MNTNAFYACFLRQRLELTLKKDFQLLRCQEIPQLHLPCSSIENVLDKLSDMREELLILERTIERIEAARRRDGSGKPRSGEYGDKTS